MKEWNWVKVTKKSHNLWRTKIRKKRVGGLELEYSWRVDLAKWQGVLSFSQHWQKISTFLASGKWKEFGVSGLSLLVKCEVSHIMQWGWDLKIAKGIQVESESKVLQNGQDPAQTIQPKIVRYLIVFFSAPELNKQWKVTGRWLACCMYIYTAPTIQNSPWKPSLISQITHIVGTWWVFAWMNWFSHPQFFRGTQ